MAKKLKGEEIVLPLRPYLISLEGAPMGEMLVYGTSSGDAWEKFMKHNGIRGTSRQNHIHKAGSVTLEDVEKAVGATNEVRANPSAYDWEEDAPVEAAGNVVE